LSNRGALVALGAAAIVAVAAVLRLWALPDPPGGLHQDEAVEADEALQLLDLGHYHPIFFGDQGGRPALFAYLVAFAFRIAGPSVAALRMTAAVLGVLGVVVVGLALRRFGTTVALVGMAWAAGALWLIAASRDGFGDTTVVAIGAAALWALLRWIDRPGRRTAILAGAVSGAGLWSYQPLKLIPLVVVVWLFWLRRVNRPAWEALRPHLAWVAAGYLLVGAPMIATAILDPADYFGRISYVSPFNRQMRVGGAQGIPMHLLRTIGMFGFVGDVQPRHNAGNLPLLSLPLTLVAALGGWRAWRARSEAGSALLLAGAIVFFLPPLLATEGGSPHFLRALGLAPYLAGLLGLGAVEAFRLGGSLGTRLRRPGLVAPAAGVLCAAALVAATVQGAAAYFGEPVADLYRAYAYDAVALGDLAARSPGATVVVDDYSEYVVRFVARDQLPAIVRPGTRLLDAPGAVLALDREQLVNAVGDARRGAVRPVAFDPGGQPTVWQVER
jgi:4-amino-4-deoxy-L-arabinose transferase-like glycosyltransferase